MNTKNDKRQKILDAALNCFAHYGLHASSIKLIAAEAGIKSPALIYHYFEDKEDLFYKCIDYYNSQKVDFPTKEEIQQCKTHDEFFKMILSYYIKNNSNEIKRKINYCGLSELYSHPEIMQYILNTSQSGLVNAVAEYTEPLIARGLMRDVPAIAIFRQLIAPVYVQLYINMHIQDSRQIPSLNQTVHHSVTAVSAWLAVPSDGTKETVS